MEEATIISLEKLNKTIDDVLLNNIPDLHKSNPDSYIKSHFPDRLFNNNFKLDKNIKLQKGDKLELKTLYIVNIYFQNKMKLALDKNNEIIEFEIENSFIKLIADAEIQNNIPTFNKLEYIVILKFPKELDYLKDYDRLKSIFMK